MSRWLALIAYALLIAACSTARNARIEAARHGVVSPDGVAGQGGLSVNVQRAVGDGRYVRIEGTIENHFTERVEGVRFAIQLMHAGTPPRVVDTVYHEADTSLDPGEDKLLRLKIENTRVASAPWLFEIAAQPVRLGGRELPPLPRSK